MSLSTRESDALQKSQTDTHKHTHTLEETQALTGPEVWLTVFLNIHGMPGMCLQVESLF